MKLKGILVIFYLTILSCNTPTLAAKMTGAADYAKDGRCAARNE